MKLLNTACDPSCEYFRCERRAMVKRRGNPRIMCAYIGDECMAGRCQYAFCKYFALLPSGECKRKMKSSSKVPAKRGRQEPKEAKLEEKALSMLRKKVGRSAPELE